MIMLEGPAEIHLNIVALKDECINKKNEHSVKLSEIYSSFHLLSYDCIRKKYKQNDKLQNLCRTLQRYHFIVNYELVKLIKALGDLCEISVLPQQPNEDQAINERYLSECNEVTEVTKSILNFLINPQCTNLFEALKEELKIAELLEFEEVSSLEADIEENFAHIPAMVFDNIKTSKRPLRSESSDSFDSESDDLLLNKYAGKMSL